VCAALGTATVDGIDQDALAESPTTAGLEACDGVTFKVLSISQPGSGPLPPTLRLASITAHSRAPR
jgi:hypothetical protein